LKYQRNITVIPNRSEVKPRPIEKLTWSLKERVIKKPITVPQGSTAQPSQVEYIFPEPTSQFVESDEEGSVTIPPVITQPQETSLCHKKQFLIRPDKIEIKP
jgi:hypothetical protein